jgi:hypothetical protein
MTGDRFVQIAAPMFVGLCIVVALVNKLRDNRPGDVRTVWYFFSLAAVVTGLVIRWGTQAQGISETGEFTATTAGRFLSEVQQLAMDLEADFDLVVAVAAVLVLPQLLNYILCGAFGCATRPWLLGPGAAFVVWSLAKFFVFFAGMSVMWGICSYAFWGRPFEALFLYLAFATLSMTMATSLLGAYRCMDSFVSCVTRRTPAWALRAIRRMDAFATRHVPKSGA